jgi:hypothetical protein
MLQAICGSARLIQPVGMVCEGVAEIEIVSITSRGMNCKRYFCRCLAGCFQLFGWDDRRKETTHYDLGPNGEGGFTCDCPDATYRANRQGGCRHARAIAVLVAAGKLPAITGPVEDKAARGDYDPENTAA